MFGLLNLLWGDTWLSGKLYGSSIWKPQVFVKCQTRVMAKNYKMSPFWRGCMIFGLVNLWSSEIGLSWKSHGVSTRKPQVFIKSQTGVVAKKLPKLYMRKEQKEIWLCSRKFCKNSFKIDSFWATKKVPKIKFHFQSILWRMKQIKKFYVSPGEILGKTQGLY